MYQRPDQPSSISVSYPRMDSPLFTTATASVLQAALAPGWMAERIVEPHGEAMIAVVAIDDDPMLPTFLLYETPQAARVATIVDDAWVAEQQCAGCDDAVTSVIALVAATRASTTGGRSPPARIRSAA